MIERWYVNSLMMSAIIGIVWSEKEMQKLTLGAERWSVSYVSVQLEWFFKRNGLRPPNTADCDGFLVHLAGKSFLPAVEAGAPFIAELLIMMIVR